MGGTRKRFVFFQKYDCRVQTKSEWDQRFEIEMCHANVDVPKLHFWLRTDVVPIVTDLATIFAVLVLKFAVFADYRSNVSFLKFVVGQIFNVIVTKKGICGR